MGSGKIILFGSYTKITFVEHKYADGDGIIYAYLCDYGLTRYRCNYNITQLNFSNVFIHPVNLILVSQYYRPLKTDTSAW